MLMTLLTPCDSQGLNRRFDFPQTFRHVIREQAHEKICELCIKKKSINREYLK
jgi:hypothetical protein